MCDCDYIFEYTDHFDFEDFVNKMTPILEDTVMVPYYANIGFHTSVKDDMKCGREFRDMFERMGLKEYDGRSDVDIYSEFPYIDLSVRISYGHMVMHGKLPVYLDGSISIKRKSIKYTEGD